MYMYMYSCIIELLGSLLLLKMNSLYVAVAIQNIWQSHFTEFDFGPEWPPYRPKQQFMCKIIAGTLSRDPYLCGDRALGFEDDRSAGTQAAFGSVWCGQNSVLAILK